jgi:hypothetical protein
MDINDMIFYKNDNDVIQSGGFSVNSLMMKAGLSPIITVNNHSTGTNNNNNNNVSDIFKHLTVPNFLALNGQFSQKGGYQHKNIDDIISENESNADNEIIEDDLHNKLLKLVEPNSKELKEHNKSNKSNKFKKTKKHKKHHGINKSSFTKKK